MAENHCVVGPLIAEASCLIREYPSLSLSSSFARSTRFRVHRNSLFLSSFNFMRWRENAEPAHADDDEEVVEKNLEKGSKRACERKKGVGFIETLIIVSPRDSVG